MCTHHILQLKNITTISLAKYAVLKTNSHEMNSLNYSVQYGMIFTNVCNYIALTFPTQKIPFIFTLQHHYASPGVTVG